MAQHGGVVPARHGVAWQAWLCLFRQGLRRAWCGALRQARQGAVLRGAVLRGMAGSAGWARLGTARQGPVWQVWQAGFGKASCGLLWSGRYPPVWLGHGTAGRAWHGSARLGTAWHGTAGKVRLV